jgi:hypothetical protein
LKNEENQEDILEFFEILSHQVFQVSWVALNTSYHEDRHSRHVKHW